MRLLITGGAGFIGSELVRRLVATGDHDVTVLDKLSYAGNLANLSSLVETQRWRFVQGDICDRDLVRELAAETDAIINLAAESHVDRSLRDPGGFIHTDVFGTWVLIEAAREARHERFLQVSTDEVYGEVMTGRVTEDAPFLPRSPYSASKAGAELQIRAYMETYGFPAVITRGSNTYGHNQYPEKIVPLFIVNALEGRALPIYGDGSAVRDYLHVSDHAAAIECVLTAGTPGLAYNVASGNEISGVAMCDAILSATGAAESLKSFVRDRPGHDSRYAVDTSRIEALGWRPLVAFDEGLASTVAWYSSNREWWQRLRDPDYWAFYTDTFVEVRGSVTPTVARTHSAAP